MPDAHHLQSDCRLVFSNVLLNWRPESMGFMPSYCTAICGWGKLLKSETLPRRLRIPGEPKMGFDNDRIQGYTVAVGS